MVVKIWRNRYMILDKLTNRVVAAAIIGLCCIVSDITKVYAESKQEIAARYYEDGVSSYGAESYGQAIDFFTKSYALVPYSETAFYLSAAFSKVLANKEARRYAQIALDSKPPLNSRLAADARKIIAWTREVEDTWNNIPAELRASADIAVPPPPDFRRLPQSPGFYKASSVTENISTSGQKLSLKNRDSYHFSKGARGKLSGGDFYLHINDDGQAKFFANNRYQRGLVDIGDVGNTALNKVSIPESGYYKFGVPAIEGHTYISLAKEGEEGHYIIFRVVKVRSKGVVLRYFYR
jgi:hypothetical protein